MSKETTQPAPQWQPSSMIFTMGTTIDGMLVGAQEQYQTLLEARPKPHVLDDALVARVVQVYTAQRDDLWLWDEQLRRWSAEPLKPLQQREALRLHNQMAALHTAVEDILALADELGRGTIERVLARDDAELGLEMLLKMMGEERR